MLRRIAYFIPAVWGAEKNFGMTGCVKYDPWFQLLILAK
jgi:hypothetical protein